MPATNTNGNANASASENHNDNEADMMLGLGLGRGGGVETDVEDQEQDQEQDQVLGCARNEFKNSLLECPSGGPVKVTNRAQVFDSGKKIFSRRNA